MDRDAVTMLQDADTVSRVELLAILRDLEKAIDSFDGDTRAVSLLESKARIEAVLG